MVTLHSDITVGRRRRTVELPGVRLIEACYTGGFVIPPHTHTTANITVVLTGELEESSEGRTHRCDAGNVVLKPAGTTHSNRFGPMGARTLVVEVVPDPKVLGRSRLAKGWNYHWVSGGQLTRTMLRLFEASRTCDPEQLSVEIDGVFSSLRAGAGDQQAYESAPGWLTDVCAIIEAHLTEPLQVQEIARLIGKHRVYLTRMFRRLHGTSVSAYIQWRRVTRVASMLTTCKSPLSEVAESSGFADQAHMTRIFKSQMGITPGVFRRLLA